MYINSYTHTLIHRICMYMYASTCLLLLRRGPARVAVEPAVHLAGGRACRGGWYGWLGRVQ